MESIPLRTIKLSIVLLVLGIGVFAGTSTKTAKGKSTMNGSNTAPYSVLYANPQRNSYTNVGLTCIGERAWKKTYKPEFDEVVSAPVVVLASGTNIGIQVNPYFLLYKNGTLSKEHNTKAISSEVGVFLDGKYAVVKDDGSIEKYFSYNGGLIATESIDGYLDDWWYLKLIAPYKNGLILAKQFTGGQTRRQKEFKICFYVPHYTGTYFGGKGEIRNVLLSSTGDKLLFTQKDIHLLDPATGKEVRTFDSNLPSLFSASLDLSDNLILHGINKGQKEVVAAFGLDGTQHWEYTVEGTIQNRQPPVCGEDGVVFFISDSSLFCINAGAMVWKKIVFPCVGPLITVCKGNTVIIQSGFHIMAYGADGKSLFSTLITKDANEEFTAPPVVGGDGRIYTASGTALYCFK
jgi:hypothetical protein